MKLSFKFLLITLLSLILGIYGYELSQNAYYKKLGIIAIKSEINFLKSMPYILKINKENKLPVAHENVLLKNNPELNLIASVDYYNNSTSILNVVFHLYRKNKKILETTCLIDTRMRK